jgi:hypothetical protein
MIAIGRLLRTDESVIALGLLTTAVLVSPPRGGALSVALVMVAAIASMGGAVYAIRRESSRGARLARVGTWARATAALAASASTLMILDASVAAIT